MVIPTWSEWWPYQAPATVASLSPEQGSHLAQSRFACQSASAGGDSGSRPVEAQFDRAQASPRRLRGSAYRAHPRCTPCTYVVRPDAGRLTTPVARMRPSSVGPSAAQRPAIAPLTRRWALRPAGLSFASSSHHDADCQQGRLKRQSHSHYLCDA